MGERKPKRPHKQAKWSREDERRLKEMFRSGFSWREISEVIGRSMMAVRHRAYRNGLRRFSGNGKLRNPSRSTIYHRRYKSRYPEKVAAHKAVEYAITYGDLRREPCAVCGNSPTHAHHHDYDDPLNVTWLCPQCHADEHKHRSGFGSGGPF